MITPGPSRPAVDPPEDFQRLAMAEIDGTATEDELDFLEDHEPEWILALKRLLRRTDAAIDRARSSVDGPERKLVLRDLEAERLLIDVTLKDLIGEEPVRPQPTADAKGNDNTDTAHDGRGQKAQDSTADDQDDDEDDDDEEEPPGTVALQLSWLDGHVIAWAAGNKTEAESIEQLTERLQTVGAGGVGWEERDPLVLPDGTKAPMVHAPIKQALGWLVTMRTTHEDEAVAPSVTWLGLAAGLAVRLVAQGRMVPQLHRFKEGKAKGGNGRSHFRVRWAPALIDHDEFQSLSRVMPGVVSALTKSNDRRAFTELVVSDVIDAICTDAAARVEVPAPPPKPRSATEVAEAVLALMDGTVFDAPTQRGSELMKGMATWAKHVTGTSTIKLVVQLDPPDQGNAWHLRTLAVGANRKLEPVDAAMSNAPASRREQIKSELDRLEGLYKPLERGKAERRGEVILSQDEAWDLMTETGPILSAAGFEMRVPPLSRKKPKPGLRLTSTDTQESVVGARQLTTVAWSAVFGDVELSAEEIMALASESRPLVKAHGRWVELDKADLEAAAQALAERADQTRLTGADMLRHALGLEGTPLLGGISVAGDSWAANLLESAKDIPEHPPTTPEGFHGELRGYQADALAWLEFLHNAGLGGCLALDMGLGKTPTLLAHLALTTGTGTHLAILPPAVLGNWAAEARKFTPGLKVVIHHGPGRAGKRELKGVVEKADVILTTYGTAVRDIEALTETQWGKVVLDEAQTIKNPASETAQQLRRLEAHSRVVLTGTPIENGLGDLWALLDFTNPGLLGDRATFVAQLSRTAGAGRSTAEEALRTLNGVLVYRRTKAEPSIAAELPDRIDTLDHCSMTPEQIGLYQAVLDDLVVETAAEDGAPKKKGAVLAAITALKQICNHPAAYNDDGRPLDGRSGKLARLNEIVDNVFEADERVLIFTHFASWGEKLATYLSARKGVEINCYHGGLARGARDRMIEEFQKGKGPGALVLSLKAGGTGLNLTAASHVVLYDRWWNPAVEDQARDRAWRIGQTKTVVAHRLVCPGTVDERVEEVVQGKRRIADMALPKSSSVGDLDSTQLQKVLGIDEDTLITEDDLEETTPEKVSA